MLFTLAVLIVICVLVVISKHSQWRNKRAQLMPGKKPRFFDILGDAKEFIDYNIWQDKSHLQTKIFDVLRRKTEEFGKHHLFCLWLFYSPFVVIVRAEAVKEMMEKKINDKNFTYQWIEPVMGTGLLTSEVSKWKPRRKLLMPCFHSDILRGFFPVFNEHSQKLVKLLREEINKDFTYIETFLTHLALDIICETMFGVNIGALGNDNSQYATSLRRLTELYMQKLFKIQYWPDCIFKLSKYGKELEHHTQILHDFTRNIIREKKKRYLNGEKDTGKRKALMDLLLEKHIEAGELSEEDIREEVDTFAIAGHETVSTTVGWTLYLIGLYSDVQARIHEELDKVFGKDMERPATEQDLANLQYLDCVLKETNRLYPAAPWFGRKIPEKDTSICGHILPKGTACCFMTYFIHRDEEIFPDPEKFDPERFFPENSHKIPEYAYIPFAAGQRNCIGQRFATMEIKVIVSSILRNFSIESLDPREDVKPFIFVTLHPSRSLRIRIRPRATPNT